MQLNREGMPGKVWHPMAVTTRERRGNSKYCQHVFFFIRLFRLTTMKTSRALRYFLQKTVGNRWIPLRTRNAESVPISWRHQIQSFLNSMPDIQKTDAAKIRHHRIWYIARNSQFCFETYFLIFAIRIRTLHHGNWWSFYVCSINFNSFIQMNGPCGLQTIPRQRESNNSLKL